MYVEFDEDIHIEEDFEIPSEWGRVRAIDFGYTNPFVCLWGALDGDGRLHVYRERYKAGARTSEHAKAVIESSGSEIYASTVADHDAAERAELDAAGIRTKAAAKNVMSGIQAVKERLCVKGDGRPRLMFFKSLKHTLSEIYDYRWEERRDGLNMREEPVKESDHAMDALRYMVMEIDRGCGMKEFRTESSSRNNRDGRWG